MIKNAVGGGVSPSWMKGDSLQFGSARLVVVERKEAVPVRGADSLGFPGRRWLLAGILLGFCGRTSSSLNGDEDQLCGLYPPWWIGGIL